MSAAQSTQYYALQTAAGARHVDRKNIRGSLLSVDGKRPAHPTSTVRMTR